ncbi:hypothetical protein LSH36_199g05028 [Paralvinella palmiformis]|uniref:RING-CH-type domain-containing protein n=1 Tax=Paralvinella palmiformis TaxID=53620 RepID=A0AAD9JR58_9ANNE|nr:hypothetical protein LSH36_199g05028 [Paralvinella palmiformis]
MPNKRQPGDTPQLQASNKTGPQHVLGAFSHVSSEPPIANKQVENSVIAREGHLNTPSTSEFTIVHLNQLSAADLNNNDIQLCTTNEECESDIKGHETDTEQTKRKRTASITSSIDSVCCRICHEDDSEEMLLSLCYCSGTMGLMHKSCMERWLAVVGSDKCEICGFCFITKRSKKSFSEWLTGESSRDDRQNLFGDCACFLVLTPLAIISTWLCITGAMYYHHEGSYFTNWESWGLITLTFLLILIYVTWCGVAIKYHIRAYFIWQEKNQTVQVLSETSHDKAPDEIHSLNRDDNNSTTSSGQILFDIASENNTDEFTAIYTACNPEVTLSRDPQPLV